MKKRINIEFVSKFFESKEYKLLSKEYINAKTHLSALCSKGHTVSITWDAFKNGRRCAKCSKRKVTIEDVKEHACSVGYELISNNYINAKVNLIFRCPKGHTFPMTWNNFKNNGRRCPDCQGLRRWSYEEVKAYFNERGYLLLSKTYKNVNQKLKFLCPEGHKSVTTFNKFKNAEHGCDYCGGSKRLTLKFVRNLFKKEGLNLLEDEYMNAGTPMKFECTCGNIDTVTYRRFMWAGEGKNPKRKCWKCMIPDWHYTLNEEERIKERKYPEYYRWVKEVKERDDYTCDCCGYIGLDVVAHHLDGYSWCKEKRTDVNNGVTLCTNCHDEFHSKYQIKNNTKAQYLDFFIMRVFSNRTKFKMVRKTS
ncbi:HNH endonuclease signature motif containing protein [Bacillus sp. 1P10SD]|uniref:HNH endonuclease signature motif containing protein n=1 Tax=Bacillus sp. 1P10SD TaxID=3132265 RepID=UPI0039A40156